MKAAALRSCTRPELLALAAKANIPGRSRMSKAQLIEAIRAHAPAPRPRRPPERPVRPGARIPATMDIPPPRLRDADSAVEEKPELEELTDLPSSYGRTRLTLMEIDPYRIHAYWEVTPHDHEAALTQLGPERATAQWVLRFYDVTYIDFDGTNAHSSFNHPIDLATGSWYVKLWSSEKTYCTELGAVAPSGRFVPACRSNFVHLPRGEASPDYHPAWLEGVADLDTHAAPPRNGATVAGLEPQAPSPSGLPPVTEADVRQCYEELVPTNDATAAFQAEPGEPAVTAAAGMPAEPATVHEPVTEGTTDGAPVPVQTTGPGPAAVFPSPGAPDTVRLPDPVSSFGSGGWTAARRPGIDLQLNAEVAISGRAQPGQTIQVNGQWVQANADGTFSVRLALPIKA